MSTIQKTRRFTVLIDAENVSHKQLKLILQEISKHGDIVVRRIYGDWSTKSLSGWKEILQANPIRQIQQFQYDKNASDGSIIMDAIELVHQERQSFNAFAIVSSDGGFYSLALRLREYGMYVLGMGEKKTKPIFVNSCNQFIYFENLNEPTSKKHVASDKVDTALHMIQDAYAIGMSASDDNQLPLSQLGTILRHEHPDFDPRSYGNANTLLSLVKQYPNVIETKKVKTTWFISIDGQ